LPQSVEHHNNYIPLIVKDTLMPKKTAKLVVDRAKVKTKYAYNLKSIPEDVIKYLLKKQGEHKEKKGICQYSLELTIYEIIRQHKFYNEIKL